MKLLPRPITIFLFLALITVSITLFRTLNPKTTDLYVKIKVAQGLWWSESTTNGPPAWLLSSLLAEQTHASPAIVDLTYYPIGIYPEDNELAIYLTFKLPTTHNQATNTYTFQRSPLKVGAPINLETNNHTLNGIVIDFGQSPFDEQYQELTLTLTKKQAEPWEYDAIKLGDSFSNTHGTIFEVIDKSTTPANSLGLSQDPYGSPVIASNLPSNYITLTVKVLAKKIGDLYVFGEEQILVAGNNLNFSTPNFNYSYFEISSLTPSVE